MLRIQELEQLKEQNMENILAISVEINPNGENNSIIKALGRISISSDLKNKYNLLLYGNQDWFLDENIFHGICNLSNNESTWLIDAILDQEEKNRSDISIKFESNEILDILENFAKSIFDDINIYSRSIFTLSNEEFSDIYDILKPGKYIFSII